LTLELISEKKRFYRIFGFDRLFKILFFLEKITDFTDYTEYSVFLPNIVRVGGSVVRVGRGFVREGVGVIRNGGFVGEMGWILSK
jgi:hypothetical protein